MPWSASVAGARQMLPTSLAFGRSTIRKMSRASDAGDRRPRPPPASSRRQATSDDGRDREHREHGERVVMAVAPPRGCTAPSPVPARGRAGRWSSARTRTGSGRDDARDGSRRTRPAAPRRRSARRAHVRASSTRGPTGPQPRCEPARARCPAGGDRAGVRAGAERRRQASGRTTISVTPGDQLDPEAARAALAVAPS